MLTNGQVVIIKRWIDKFVDELSDRRSFREIDKKYLILLIDDFEELNKEETNG